MPFPINSQMQKEKLRIIKIGGNVVDTPSVLSQVLRDFSAIEGRKIVVHGGGKIADVLLKKMDIVPQKIEGRRITDAATLDVVTMVYAGLINKKMVAELQSIGCNALGLTGADVNAIEAHKRVSKNGIDYGFAGDIDAVNTDVLSKLLDSVAETLVFAPITHDKKGQLLNTNADTIAATLAVALSEKFDVTLKYIFEKKGVLADPKDDESVISTMNYADFQAGKADGSIYEGMIPKLDNAFNVLKSGVSSVVICGIEGVNSAVGTVLIA
jgi:acetylglutamate kinase